MYSASVERYQTNRCFWWVECAQRQWCQLSQIQFAASALFQLSRWTSSATAGGSPALTMQFQRSQTLCDVVDSHTKKRKKFGVFENCRRKVVSISMYCMYVCCCRCMDPILPQKLLDWLCSNFCSICILGHNKYTTVFFDTFLQPTPILHYSNFLKLYITVYFVRGYRSHK